MWILLLATIHLAFTQAADKNLDSVDAGVGVSSNALDQELASMSKELDDSQPVVKEEKKKESNVGFGDPGHTALNEGDAKRFVELGPGEELGIVQYNVAPLIISTRPGDKFGVFPLGGKKTTPCPTTTSKNPHPHMYCQSCGKQNPKERGLVTSYIDVTNSKECASLCARYISKGKRCDVWEYHGEWRNKQCFLLYIPNFTRCKGDVGLLGEMSFESGTCDQASGMPGGTDSDFEEGDSDVLDDGLPSWFPRVESSVGSTITNNPTTVKLSLVVLFMLFAGYVLYGRSKRPAAGYEELLDTREEV